MTMMMVVMMLMMRMMMLIMHDEVCSAPLGSSRACSISRPGRRFRVRRGESDCLPPLTFMVSCRGGSLFRVCRGDTVHVRYQRPESVLIVNSYMIVHFLYIVAGGFRCLAANDLSRAEAGNRASKTMHGLQWWDTEPE